MTFIIIEFYRKYIMAQTSSGSQDLNLTNGTSQAPVVNQNAVTVFAKWKVKDGQIKEVLSLLKTVREESIREKGNLFYKIHQSKSDVNTIILFEGYKTDDAVAEHRASPHFQTLVLEKIVPLLENREVILTTPLDAF